MRSWLFQPTTPLTLQLFDSSPKCSIQIYTTTERYRGFNKNFISLWKYLRSVFQFCIQQAMTRYQENCQKNAGIPHKTSEQYFCKVFSKNKTWKTSFFSRISKNSPEWPLISWTFRYKSSCAQNFYQKVFRYFKNLYKVCNFTTEWTKLLKSS